MKINLSQISPSPWNPKKPFTQAERKKLRNSLDEYPGLVYMIVCNDFDKGEGFYCLDGNDRLSVLAERGDKYVDGKICEQVTNLKQLKKFITVFDYNRKKYIGSQINEEIGNSFTELEINELISFDSSIYDLKAQDFTFQEYEAIETEQFFLTLPSGTAKSYRRRFKNATPINNKERLDKIVDSLTDEEILKYIINKSENRNE